MQLLMFADDTVLLAETEEDLQHNVRPLEFNKAKNNNNGFQQEAGGLQCGLSVSLWASVSKQLEHYILYSNSKHQIESVLFFLFYCHSQILFLISPLLHFYNSFSLSFLIFHTAGLPSPLHVSVVCQEGQRLCISCLECVTLQFYTSDVVLHNAPPRILLFDCKNLSICENCHIL